MIIIGIQQTALSLNVQNNEPPNNTHTHTQNTSTYHTPIMDRFFFYLNVVRFLASTIGWNKYVFIVCQYKQSQDDETDILGTFFNFLIESWTTC